MRAFKSIPAPTPIPAARMIPMALPTTLRSLLGGKREARIARQLSLQAVDALRELQATAPDLSGEALYEHILATRFGLDQTGAHALIEGARENYAEWPVERELRFSDVVRQLVADRCLDDQEPDETHWIDGRIGRTVRSIIPEDV